MNHKKTHTTNNTTIEMLKKIMQKGNFNLPDYTNEKQSPGLESAELFKPFSSDYSDLSGTSLDTLISGEKEDKSMVGINQLLKNEKSGEGGESKLINSENEKGADQQLTGGENEIDSIFKQELGFKQLSLVKGRTQNRDNK